MSTLRMAPLVAALSFGCSASIEYGRPDPPPRPSSPEHACYDQQTIVVAGAETAVEWGDGTVTYRRRDGGITFYRDGQRLAPRQVLAILGDTELADTYESRLKSLARARRDYGLIALLGLAVTLGGAVSTTWAISEQAEGLAIAGAMTTMGLGVVLTLYGQSRWRQWKGTHQAYDRVFIDQTLAERLFYRLTRHERAVAKRCKFDIIAIPTP